jgi:hypothetical protein
LPKPCELSILELSLSLFQHPRENLKIASFFSCSANLKGSESSNILDSSTLPLLNSFLSCRPEEHKHQESREYRDIRSWNPDPDRYKTHISKAEVIM